jgi:hypothetical protein
MYSLLEVAGLGSRVGGPDGLIRSWHRFRQEKRAERRRLTMKRFISWTKKMKGRVPDRMLARRIVQLACRITMKTPEMLSYKDLERTGHGIEVRAAGSKKRLMELAGLSIPPWQMGHVPRNTWKDPKNRAAALLWLAEVTGKPPQRLTTIDMHEHGLGSLTLFDLQNLLKDAGLIVPRHLLRGRRQRWAQIEDRIDAVRWLARTLGKPGAGLTREDFASNGLWTLWQFYHPYNCKRVPKGEMLSYGEGWLLQYKNPGLRAAAEAGLLSKADEKKAMERHPPTKFGTREARIEAIRKAVEATGKRPADLFLKDIKRAGLMHLIEKYYGNDPVIAFRDAGYDIIPMAVRARLERRKWKDPKERIEAVRGFVEASGLPPEGLTATMLCRTGLGGLMRYKNFWDLLGEAGYDVMPWKLAKVPHGFWDMRMNRAKAVKWLIKELDIDPSRLGPKHFETNCLFGLWQVMKKRIKSEMGGRSPSSKLTLARLLEDAGLLLAARSVMLRGRMLMRYPDDPSKHRGRSVSRSRSP